jgi:hypothetical protein
MFFAKNFAEAWILDNEDTKIYQLLKLRLRILLVHVKEVNM